MSNSLKKKTVSALVWNALDKIGFQFIALLVGIITARLLSPKDFGLIGALSIFTVMSNLLVESGFTATLIRKKKVSREQYTGVLYFNILLSIALYLILFFTAPFIADFFQMPELVALSRFIFLAIIFNSFGLIQIIILTKEFKFKTLTLTNIIALGISSIITIWMAINGFEYWAIAFQQVSIILLRVLLLWFMSSFRPSLKANFAIIKELFSFSINLIATSILNVIGTNIYNIIIGKFFTVFQLGYYTQAQKYQMIPSTVITNTIQGVIYPLLTKLNDEPERQIMVFRKMIRAVSFMIFPVMLGLYVLSEELVSIVLTDKWLPSVMYFKILIIASIVYPFRILALNYFIAIGKARKYFYLELVKNLMIFSSIVFTYKSIEALLFGYAISNFLSFAINIYSMNKISSYKTIDFFKDIMPYFIISVGIVIFVELLDMVPLGLYAKTGLQIVSATIVYFVTLKVTKSQIFEEVLLLIKGKH